MDDESMIPTPEEPGSVSEVPEVPVMPEPEPEMPAPVEPPAAPEPIAAPPAPPAATAPPAPPAPPAATASPAPPAPPAPPAGAPQYAPPAAPASSDKNKVVAGLLGIFLGGLGIHKFYLGYSKEGVIMLVASIVVSLVSFGTLSWVVSLIGLIEGIMYIAKTDEEFYATYVAGRKPWF